MDNYPNNFYCEFVDSVTFPSITQYVINDFRLQGRVNRRCVDYVSIDLPYQQKKKLCGSKSGFINVPGYDFYDFFTTNSAINQTGFHITINNIVNDCTTTIQLSDPSHTSGVITSPNYPSDYPVKAACEWWIQAPAGRQIQVDFSSVTFASRKCKKSYIAVDKVGNGYYLRADTMRICRSGSATVVSDANLMKIAFYGGAKVSAGFSATYSLV